MAHHPDGGDGAALPTGIGAVHRLQHHAAVLGGREFEDRASHVGRRVHLRSGLPGRCGRPGWGGHPEPEPGRLPQHCRFCRIHRPGRRQGDLVRARSAGGSGGADSSLFRSALLGRRFGVPHIRSRRGRHRDQGHRAPTDLAAPWSTLRQPVDLRAGTNSVELRCAPGETCADEFDTLEWDTLSLSPVGSPAPDVAQTGPLGGWIRGFDTATYAANPTCTDGEQGDTCQAGLEPLNTDGLLDEAGWRLLDDSQSAVWTRSGWVAPRAAGGDVQDGYLFAYGNDYLGALHELEELTGPAPLLPRSVFGVWYSDYTPYSSADIENSVYPAFVAHQVPLNTLSLDTDWKAPNDWNGWEWNASLFPTPRSFLSWAHEHGIQVTLNIHSSIDDNDPALPVAERMAGGDLAASSCSDGPCKVWDWSSVAQAESNFALQQSFERQGVAFWWLDWCCDDSVASMTGITPDWWIDHLYAQEMVDRGARGFVLARIGGSNGEPEEVYPAGPWSAHTTGIAFTGDAWGTWNTLAQEVTLTPAEASIGEPYVSDDIGSYLGPPPTQSGADPPDLYDRWVQFGTFQPILRLHSNNEDRLPWEYPEPVQSITEAFLRLREDLIPYSYALAAESYETGAPITRPLYLDDPDDAAAYDNPEEYLYGPDVLVAPVTVPGDDPTVSVWLPPGRWIDYFTGATFTGPATVSMTVPLSRLPVFVRAGGIVPEQDGGIRAVIRTMRSPFGPMPADPVRSTSTTTPGPVWATRRRAGRHRDHDVIGQPRWRGVDQGDHRGHQGSLPWPGCRFP